MSTIEEQLKALREETLVALKQITAENEKRCKIYGSLSLEKGIAD